MPLLKRLFCLVCVLGWRRRVKVVQEGVLLWEVVGFDEFASKGAWWVLWRRGVAGEWWRWRLTERIGQDRRW